MGDALESKTRHLSGTRPERRREESVGREKEEGKLDAERGEVMRLGLGEELWNRSAKRKQNNMSRTHPSESSLHDLLLGFRAWGRLDLLGQALHLLGELELS